MTSQLTQSESNTSAHPDLNEQDSQRVYCIYRKPFRRHYEVKSPAGQLLYYGEVSEFKRAKPDLTLHRGTSANAPVVAATKMIKFSGHFKLSQGDPDDLNNVEWEDMTRQSRLHQSYRFELNMPGSENATHPERRTFLWKRTRSVGIHESVPAWSPRNYKLVDEKTGELVAVFTNKWAIGECGRLQIKEEHGEWFGTMILLSYMSIYEKLNRRNRQSASAAGGGA